MFLARAHFLTSKIRFKAKTDATMKLIAVWLTAAAVALLVCSQHVLAFTPVPRVARVVENGSRLAPNKNKMPPLTQLGYRALDENDEETTMLRTANRVPVGYDMKKALAEQQGPRTAMNTPLIAALLINQAVIVTLGIVATFGLLFFTAGGFSGPLSDIQDFVHWTGGPPSDMGLFTSVAVGAFGGAGTCSTLTYY